MCTVMEDSFTVSGITDTKVIDFVSKALRENKLSGLSKMLEAIAEAVDAYGCVLWQVTPNSNLKTTPPQGTLFVLAEWLKENRPVALYNLPLKSVSGHAVLTQTSINVPDILKEPLNVLTPFQEATGIKTMCAVPITFMDGEKGTVNLYRNVPRPFSPDEIRVVEQLASLVPALYERLRDKVSLSLISSVDDIINDAEQRSRKVLLPLEEIKTVCGSVCARIAATFHNIEASLFLHVDIETKDSYELMATTWQGRFKKKIYRANDQEGITGWVLWHGTAIKIFDLVNFDSDKNEIRKRYPDVTWRDSLDIKTSARELLNLTDEANLPPLSFMAAPVLIGDDVLGVIRCCTAKGGPYYFDDRDLELLMLVAAQVGRFANNWLTRREMQQENDSWQALVRSVTTLNRFVQKELTREKPNEFRIFEEALKLTSSAIPGAEIMDVRLHDGRTKELYFAVTHGTAWNEGTETEIENRKNRRFKLIAQRESAGTHVFNTGKLYVVQDADTDPYYSKTFPFIKRMIIAPISVEREKFGVLDIRATRDSDFPKHAEAIAELLGQQLGLYHYLANTIGRLRETETELKNTVAGVRRMQKEQAQTFEDLEHQFRSPIVQAYARVHSILNDEQLNARDRANLEAIRGLCGKAKRVAMSTGLFAKLAREETIEPTRKRLNYEHLMKVLNETAADHELITNPTRDIRFRVDRRSYEVLAGTSIEIDYDLLEQAISNLLDNAAKYSFPRTRIDVTWGMTRGDRFHITVFNRGLPIRAEEIRSCRNRGWRGSMAAATTGEGSGIGLWIVENIMEAHNGELIVVPTTSNGVTEIKLVFPLSKRSQTK
jgi:signal transduction histidine kinase